MSRPNFAVKVPFIPPRPRQRTKRARKRTKPYPLDNHPELGTINESNTCLTRRSSYYSLHSPDSSQPKLKVIETYDEFLNLKDLDKIYWKNSSNVLHTDSEQSTDGIILLKQICANLNLEVTTSKKEHQLLSLFPKDPEKKTQCDLQTAIIAKRIIDTQEQITNTKKNSSSTFSKESLKKASFNKSIKSLGPADKLPGMSLALRRALSNLTSRYSIKQRCPTSELEVQVDFKNFDIWPLSHSCNTQTDAHSLTQSKHDLHQEIQACSTTKTQQVQSSLVEYEDKCCNTASSSFFRKQEQCTQMYEHITKNDLFCMEWIDKNLFRVSVNPNTVIVDEKLRDLSEFTCPGTNVFEQEFNWERQALCL